MGVFPVEQDQGAARSTWRRSRQIQGVQIAVAKHRTPLGSAASAASCCRGGSCAAPDRPARRVGARAPRHNMSIHCSGTHDARRHRQRQGVNSAQRARRFCEILAGCRSSAGGQRPSLDPARDQNRRAGIAVHQARRKLRGDGDLEHPRLPGSIHAELAGFVAATSRRSAAVARHAVGLAEEPCAQALDLRPARSRHDGAAAGARVQPAA